MAMVMAGRREWRSFLALRRQVQATPVDKEITGVVVEGRLMHQRRISRKCSFFDLASVDTNESDERLEVILKIIDDELSIEEVEAIRHRINVGDVVHIHGFIERMVNTDSSDPTPTSILLHARSISTIRTWREEHPDMPFLPAPTIRKDRKLTAPTPTPAPLTSASASASPPYSESTRDAAISIDHADKASVPQTAPHQDGNQQATRMHCKFWINTLSCQYGDHCEMYHASKSEIREERAKWLQERLQRKRERAMIGEDPLDPHGKIGKNQRATVFVDWLIDTFGRERLASGGGVLDIAGGRGDVSFELWNKRQIPSTLIDPRPMKLSRMQYKHFKRQKIDKASIPAALSAQKSALFNTTTFLKEATNVALIENASVLVGMHPDEATDAIFDIAKRFNKPFAVVPCCVYGQKFPDRRMPDGTRKVLSYEDLVVYLSAKEPSAVQGFLPFDGKNLVLYRLPSAEVSNQTTT